MINVIKAIWQHDSLQSKRNFSLAGVVGIFLVCYLFLFIMFVIVEVAMT